MKRWILFGVSLAVVVASAVGHLRRHDRCELREDGCEAEGYKCVNGRCQCSHGYISSHPYNGTCLPCPVYGEACWGQCCSSRQDPLQCWQSVCQNCHDLYGNWICSDQMNSQMLISATQIAMGTALVLGILATFVLLYKLCAATDVRPFGVQATTPSSRLSVGSMQLYVDERLRDPPPRYSRASPGGVPPVFPLHGYLNAGFMHDSSVPPPPYSAPHKNDEPVNSAVHM